MAISRAERRAERKGRVVAMFGEVLAAPALDLLELTEFAWHDCYGEITPSEEIVDEILLCSDGELAKLIQAARLAVEDRRDLKMWAQDLKMWAQDLKMWAQDKRSRRSPNLTT